MQGLYQLNATITHFLEGFLETAVPMIAGLAEVVGLFLMSAEIAKTFLLQNLESVVPLAATFALRAMMSLLLHWEMEGGHRPANAKGEEAGEKK